MSLIWPMMFLSHDGNGTVNGTGHDGVYDCCDIRMSTTVFRMNCRYRLFPANKLEQVFVDVGSLPTMVTPVCDPDGALRMTPVVSAPEGFLLPHAADLNQAQPEAGLSFTGTWRVACFLLSPRPRFRQLRLVTVVSRTQLGGPRVPQICLVMGNSTYTRIIRAPPPLRSCCRTPRGVCFG